jgi:hypothetical protein
MAAAPSPQVKQRVNAVACEIASRLWGGSWRAVENEQGSVVRLDDFRTTGLGQKKAA